MWFDKNPICHLTGASFFGSIRSWPRNWDDRSYSDQSCPGELPLFSMTSVWIAPIASARINIGCTKRSEDKKWVAKWAQSEHKNTVK